MRKSLQLIAIGALLAVRLNGAFADALPLSDLLAISDGTSTTTFRFVEVGDVDQLETVGGLVDVPHPLSYQPSLISGTFATGSNYLVLNELGGGVSDVLRLDIVKAPLVAPSLTFNFYDAADPALPILDANSCSASGVSCTFLSEAGFDTLQNVTGYMGLANSNISVTFQSDINVSAIPEPQVYWMMGIGLLLMGFVAHRRKQQESA